MVHQLGKKLLPLFQIISRFDIFGLFILLYILDIILYIDA
jgi:hypothetical protein